MATPASSATSPSPPMPYRTHVPPPEQPQAGSSTDPGEQEQRKKAVQKFLARAEIAMVTRALRARLAYASYKATHNIPHVSLPQLEAQSQSQSQTASFNRTIAAKRKAVGGSTGYYNNPATQGPNAPGPSSGGLRRGGSGIMAPPASISSPRTHTPSSSISYPNYGDLMSGLRNATQGPTLYTSILAPPPSKQARTIHNPNDPPVPAPERPTPSPRVRPAKTSPKTKTEPSKSQASKTKAAAKAGKAGKAAASPRRTKGGSIDKGKRRQHHQDEVPDVDIDGDVDMKAAATLTSLLMHNRPSIAGSTSSPRSSIDGGSEYSYAHFAQSSARTNATGQGHTSTGSTSTSNLASEPPINRLQTPPPPGMGGPRLQTTPRAAPTDSEAANLMLFLATSPSPARPPTKDAKDMAAYRALSGGTGPLRSKGRVLFPSGDLSAQPPSGSDDAGSSYRPISSSLTRGSEGSFGSSISSIGLGPELGTNAARTPPSGGLRPSSAGSASSTAGNNGVSQLLPPALLPLPSAPSSPSRNAPVVKEGSAAQLNPPSGVSVASAPSDFNFHEYIHPSPRNPTGAPLGHAHSSSIGSNGSGHKSNLGLRADVGRKLFEEEQMRNAQALQLAAAAAAAAASAGGATPNAAAAAAGAGASAHRTDERTLGAGIDLIHSRS